MRKRVIKVSVLFFFFLILLFMSREFGQDKNERIELIIPPIIRVSIMQSLKMREDLGLNLGITKEIIPQEPTLVEKISNPRLREWPWDEYEKPFNAYASRFDLVEQNYEHMPQAGLKSAASWGEEIVYDLILHPERIEEYGAVLTESSVEAWKSFQWIYANPEGYYCYKYTHDCVDNGEYISYLTYVLIPPEYFRGDSSRLNSLDRTFADGVTQELLEYIGSYQDIGLTIDWEYERGTGLIQVIKMEYMKISGTH